MLSFLFKHNLKIWCQRNTKDWFHLFEKSKQNSNSHKPILNFVLLQLIFNQYTPCLKD